MVVPDLQEKRIRFGCGFVVGFFIFGLIGFKWALQSGQIMLGLAVFGAIVFGFLAMKHGDEFWVKLVTWMRWW